MEKQIGRFSKGELDLIKNTFQEDDKLLFAIRKVFLQFEKNVNDRSLIKEMTPELFAVIKKSFLPELDPTAPIFQLTDPYLALSHIAQMNPAMATLHIEAKDLQIEYLEQRYEVLQGNKPVGQEVILQDLKKKGKPEERRFVEMIAYFNLVNYIDSRINDLTMLANPQKMTEEEIKKQQELDSLK